MPTRLSPDTPQQDSVQTSLAQLAAVLPPRGRVAIVPHDYPDPDALASAGGMELLLREKFGLNARVYFNGMVSRAENRELLRQFRYRWAPTTSLPARGRIPAVLVDTTPWSGNVTIPRNLDVVAVVDHHAVRRKKGIPAPPYLDLIPGLGGTVTRVAELLTGAGITLPKWLASIMVYALATETLDLSQDFGPRDQEVYKKLLARTNFRMVGKIRNAPLPREYYVQLGDAVQQARVYRSQSWTHLGQVGHPEIVAEMADLLLRMERVSWSFCTAFCQDRLLVSLRSCRPGARCGRILRKTVGKAGSAGGHPRMAAGFLDLQGVDPAAREERRRAFELTLVRNIDRRAPTGQSLEELSQPLVPRGSVPEAAAFRS